MLNQKKLHLSQDWHPWDIKAALGKRGYSLARLARENGFAITSANDVLRKRWANMERIVADVIGVEPWEIWPSRYDENNQPLYRYGSRSAGKSGSKTKVAQQK